MSQTATEAMHPASAGLHAAAGAEALRRLWSAQCDALAALPPAFPQIEAAAEAAAHTLDRRSVARVTSAQFSKR